ncbi:MAG: dihydropteroate synthase, partial [Pseudomonadota bacterium]
MTDTTMPPRPRSWAGFDLAARATNDPLVMGIVNVTPDSFSDGGQCHDPAAGIAHGIDLAQAGADILDVGGESTRPGSDTVAIQEEIARVVPVIEGLRAALPDIAISIDTRKGAVMRAAASAGATIINDVAALTFGDDALSTAAELGLPVVLMHAKGDPKTMQENPVYADVNREVAEFLAERVVACVQAGINPGA